jgi:predicted NACHT family NTPase
MTNIVYDWPRFWLPRGRQALLADGGYLYIPKFRSDIVPFNEINNIPCLVLLGEPGIGKSHALRAEQEALRAELLDGSSDILALDLRSFGSEDRLVRKLFENPIFLTWVDGDHILYLFLDSLDECLLRIDTIASILIDELQPYTERIDRLFLRITCRTAEWPIIMETGLQELWGENNVGVFLLASLRRIDIIKAAELNHISSEEFLAEVQRKEVVPLAIKPVTLKFLLNIYQRDGQLPPTKTEI